ncbi:MAG: NAD(P)/FAD-dependent oxidoreductase [Cyanobacteria bacterium]|nr:NAD(P)/FAD-dependent oxidoreductase [Cyanobacteriota bacterium]
MLWRDEASFGNTYLWLDTVIIIGGGFAGLAAARRLRNAACEVTMVDRHNHHVFQPLLYQVATAGLSPGDIASPIRWILRKQEPLRVLLATVERIDSKARQVHLDGGEKLSYDYLIVAAGATHSYFGHDEWARVAPGLKTLDDALAIRRRLLLAFEEAEREHNPVYQRRLLTFVVIGGGPTGVEMAGALGEIARQALRSEFDAVDPAIARIILIEAGPFILPSFPEDLRESARRALLRLGIDVRVGKAVTNIEEGAVWIGDERIEAHTILWAAGVAAAPLSRDLGPGLDRAGRVIVEADLSVPGDASVFVAGDLASFTHQTGKPLPGVAQVAKQQGRHAAANIARLIAGQPTTAFRYFDPGNMATIGRNAAIADFGFLRVSGHLGWLLWLFVHIAFLIGFRSRVSVMLQWAAAYLTYQRSVRLITRNPSG